MVSAFCEIKFGGFPGFIIRPFVWVFDFALCPGSKFGFLPGFIIRPFVWVFILAFCPGLKFGFLPGFIIRPFVWVFISALFSVVYNSAFCLGFIDPCSMPGHFSPDGRSGRRAACWRFAQWDHVVRADVVTIAPMWPGS
jgi:hypothetical protein